MLQEDAGPSARCWEYFENDRRLRSSMFNISSMHRDSYIPPLQAGHIVDATERSLNLFTICVLKFDIKLCTLNSLTRLKPRTMGQTNSKLFLQIQCNKLLGFVLCTMQKGLSVFYRYIGACSTG
jgi:hypothetical protein